MLLKKKYKKIIGIAVIVSIIGLLLLGYFITQEKRIEKIAPIFENK